MSRAQEWLAIAEVKPKAKPKAKKKAPAKKKTTTSKAKK